MRIQFESKSANTSHYGPDKVNVCIQLADSPQSAARRIKDNAPTDIALIVTSTIITQLTLNPSFVHLEIGGMKSEKSLNVVCFCADAGNVTANTFIPFLSEAESRLYVHTPSLTDFGATDTPLQTRSSLTSLPTVKPPPTRRTSVCLIHSAAYGSSGETEANLIRSSL